MHGSLAVFADTGSADADTGVAALDDRLQVLSADAANGDGTGDEPVLRHQKQYTALRLALLAKKRATVARLRDQRRIDDTVLRQAQARLDIEEVSLSRREVVN